MTASVAASATPTSIALATVALAHAGNGSNGHERSRAAQLVASLKQERGSGVAQATFTEGVDDEEGGAAGAFWKHLPGEANLRHFGSLYPKSPAPRPELASEP